MMGLQGKNKHGNPIFLWQLFNVLHMTVNCGKFEKKIWIVHPFQENYLKKTFKINNHDTKQKGKCFCDHSGSSCKRSALPTAAITKPHFNSHTNSVVLHSRRRQQTLLRFTS